MMLRISDIAKKYGVSIGTIRQWEKEGKIKAERTAGGHRRYKSEISLDFKHRYDVINDQIELMSPEDQEKFKRLMLMDHEVLVRSIISSKYEIT
jgi:excisionase family DNA binding protein